MASQSLLKSATLCSSPHRMASGRLVKHYHHAFWYLAQRPSLFRLWAASCVSTWHLRAGSPATSQRPGMLPEYQRSIRLRNTPQRDSSNSFLFMFSLASQAPSRSPWATMAQSPRLHHPEAGRVRLSPLTKKQSNKLTNKEAN